MTQTDVADYSVTSGETITVKVVAVAIGENVITALDGTTLDAVSRKPVVYQFPVTGVVGDLHHLGVLGIFAGAVEDSKFVISLAGSNGGNFQGPIINAGFASAAITFEVA